MSCVVKQRIQKICCIIFLWLCICQSSQASQSSPVGYWLTEHPDHKSIIAVVHIFKFKGKLMGELIRFIPVNKTIQQVCPACIAYKKSQPLVGPIIMFNYHKQDQKDKQGEFWIDGKIIDSTTARMYNSTMLLSPDGSQLYVHVYVGLIFRTTIWKRISKADVYRVIPKR